MPAIFISHSSLDGKIADDIKATLARLGFDRVFLDFDKETGIGAGENWEKRLYEELARCHGVILALTPHWMASKWCFAELQQARALGKLIFPIVCSPIGDRKMLTEIQAVDLLDWDSGGVERLEQWLRAISSELARGFTLDPRRSPYPGLHAFEAEDAAIYFGRDDETRSLIEKLDARRRQGRARLVVLIGASGSGKSSLLKAGLIPQLRRRRGHWLLFATMRPEKAPLESLAKAFADKRGEPQAWRTWHERLQGPDAIGHVTDLVKHLRVREAAAATLLVPIDQFEETFTIAEAGERAAFLALLAAMLDPARDLPIIAVATGRADVLQGLLEGSELGRLTETVPLSKMPLDRVPRLVEGPAAVAGIHVEKGLAERIMRDVETAEALPLLAYTLRLLYERGAHERRLTLSNYLALGDAARGLNPVQNSVRLTADQAIKGLEPSDQELMGLGDAFVPHLVRLRLDDSKRVRQPAPRSALPRQAERLLRALTDAHLLTVRTEDDGKADDAIVEVTHEALFDAWPMLAAFLADEHAFLADIERIKGAHRAWMQAPDNHKPKARLHGLMLARARDWLVEHPQRFAGPDMEPLRAFIVTSAEAEDARPARAARPWRRVVRWVVAIILILAGIAPLTSWQYLEEFKVRRASERAQAQAIEERDRAQRNLAVARQAADDAVNKLALDLRNVEGMRADWIRRILSTAQGLIDRLVETAPDDPQLQRSRHAMLAVFVDTYLSAGDLTAARTAAEESLSVMRRLAAADPQDANWQRELSVSFTKLGNVRIAFSDQAGALKSYEESLSIMRALTAADPANVRWQRDLGVSLDNVGDGRRLAGDHAGALAAYEESLAIRRRLAAADEGNPSWKRDISVSLSNIGSVRLSAGNRSGALAAYEEGLTIRRALAASDPGNASWQRDVAANLDSVGSVRLANGNHESSLAAYEESLEIRRKLAAAEPGNAGLQRAVAVSLERAGDVHRAARDHGKALAAYAESLAIRRKLASFDPDNTLWQRDMSIVLNKTGDVRVAAGNRAGALEDYKESLTIMRKLTTADVGNIGWQVDLVVSLYRVGLAAEPAKAREVLREALAVLEGLDREGRLTPAQRDWVTLVGQALSKLPAERT